MDDLDNMKIGFIGAGKVGVSLGAYFRSKGLCIVGYVSHSPLSSQTAAEITSSQAFKKISELVIQCELIFITTPDDQIGNVWSELACCNIKWKIICHTSGSASSDIFKGISECGAFGYSIHPMHAFANRYGRAEGLEKAYFTIEGDKYRLNDVREFFSRIGNRTIVIDQESKVLYHISNVMVSNLILSLISMGCECFEECGTDSEEALGAFIPLVTGNIENINRQGLINSLTGPVERNDTGTILKHLAVLPVRYERIYKDLTLRLVELSGKKHPERDYSELLKLLINPVE